MGVLVTGGSGFLGRRIVDEAILEGYDVLAPRSSEMDLMSRESIEKYFIGKDIDVIIHSAAYYGGLNINLEEPAELFYKNSIMTANLYYVAGVSRIKKIVAVGSSCSYPTMRCKMREDYFWDGPLHDTIEAYGFSKKHQLVGQNAIYKQFGVESNHLVIANMYGEEDDFSDYRGHAISILIKRVIEAKRQRLLYIENWGTGTAIREFLYAGDAARAIVRFIDRPHDVEPINIGPGSGVSIKKLTNMIMKIVEYNGRVHWNYTKPDGAPKKVMDNRKFLNLFPDFKFTKLKNGLKSTIDWYERNHK